MGLSELFALVPLTIFAVILVTAWYLIEPGRPRQYDREREAASRRPAASIDQSGTAAQVRQSRDYRSL